MTTNELKWTTNGLKWTTNDCGYAFLCVRMSEIE
jgi:hypothetical protein